MKKENKKGFIKMILIIVGALVLLKYIYDFDVINLLVEGKFRIVLDKTYQIGSYGWNEFRDIIIKVFKYIIELVKKIFN